MGQTSLSCLNRAGVFSYWNSSWDSKYQYAYFLTKFSYLDKFFLQFFKNQILFFRFLNLKNGLSTPVYFFKCFKIKKVTSTYIKHITRYQFCISKLWILKFGSWIILSIYIFDLGAKYQKKKKNYIKNIKRLKYKYLTTYNILNFQHSLKKGKKCRKLLIKCALRRLKKFFKYKHQQLNIDTKKRSFFCKNVKLFRKFLKKKKSKRRLKKKIFKKIYLNSKISKFFKKKEQILDNKNKVKDILNNYMYSYF